MGVWLTSESLIFSGWFRTSVVLLAEVEGVATVRYAGMFSWGSIGWLPLVGAVAVVKIRMKGEARDLPGTIGRQVTVKAVARRIREAAGMHLHARTSILCSERRRCGRRTRRTALPRLGGQRQRVRGIPFSGKRRRCRLGASRSARCDRRGRLYKGKSEACQYDRALVRTSCRDDHGQRMGSPIQKDADDGTSGSWETCCTGEHLRPR